MNSNPTWLQIAESGHYSASAIYNIIIKHDKSNKNKIKYYLRAAIYRKHFIKVLELFSRKELSAIPDKHPEVLDKIFRPYMISGSSVAERTKILRDCYELLTKRNTNLLPMIFEPEGLEVFRICGGEYKIIIKSDGTFRKEGELAISIINATNNQRVYSCAFSFCEFENQYVQLIGAVQGPKKSEVNTSASLKYITKECFGLMPKNLVVKTAKIVANIYGVNTLFSIKSKSHIYQAKRYYSLKRKAKVIFDYDALWDEFKSLPLNDDLVEIKAYQKRDLDEIASKKRAMYRKRYELLGHINQSIMKLKFD